MKRNIDIIKKRKKMWDRLGFVYKQENYLRKNHSLNCGCSVCRFMTYSRRLSNRRKRYDAKKIILDELRDYEKIKKREAKS